MLVAYESTPHTDSALIDKHWWSKRDRCPTRVLHRESQSNPSREGEARTHERRFHVSPPDSFAFVTGALEVGRWHACNLL
ncbi:MAG: hypothetical protein PVSMB7_17800 [Chloroflexota bacterium]